MLSSPIRYCGIVMSRNHGALPINKKNIGMVQAVTGYGRRNYAKDDKDSCCKNIPQAEGKQIENWPKDDPPPPMWRCDCPCEPQPPNYDPYRIKVPDIMVPPLPPSNAKWNGVALAMNTNPPPGHDPSNPGYGYGQPAYGGQSADQAKQEEDENTFLGILKGFFGKGKKTEGKGSGDTMMECPPCTAGVFFGFPDHNQASAPEPAPELFYSPTVNCDYWMHQSEKSSGDGKGSKLGYHGKIKLKYAFDEPWKPLDRTTLLEQAEREESGQVDEPAPQAETTDKQLSK